MSDEKIFEYLLEKLKTNVLQNLEEQKKTFQYLKTFINTYWVKFEGVPTIRGVLNSDEESNNQFSVVDFKSYRIKKGTKLKVKKWMFLYIDMYIHKI